jgi:hypothetical protein
LYNRDWEYLIDLDIEVIRFIARCLGINTPVIRSSGLRLDGFTGNMRIIEICKRLGAGELYDSAGSKAFIDERLFQESGIKVLFQDYKHPLYNQVFKPFLPFMSTVDLLFNEGPNSRNILLSGASQYIKAL